MADWLKVNHTLLRSAKVRSLMRELRCKKHTALGLALNWLIWVDEQTSDGNTNLLPQEVDEELGFKGASKALCAIGWANVDENGLVFAVDFGKHCGETAKARAVKRCGIWLKILVACQGNVASKQKPPKFRAISLRRYRSSISPRFSLGEISTARSALRSE